MRVLKSLLAACCLIQTMISTDLSACADFVLTAQDKSAVVGRSLEFGISLDSRIVYCPKAEVVETTVFDNQKGFSWVSKYAFLGISAFNNETFFDGLNEKGLSLGALWMPGSKYPDSVSAPKATVIPLELLSKWLLGSFATIDEVRSSLQTISIWAHEIPELNGVPPLHFSLHDAMGKSLVIEFSGGNVCLYDNLPGVLTNCPEFPWHCTNLRNYINLSAVNAAPLDYSGTVLNATGQGSGLLGLPGDWTPPSRFVRLAIYKQFVEKAKNAAENVNLAFHLLNTVDIPYGAVRENKGGHFDYTQWVVVKDLTNGTIYYRTYLDLNFKSLSLKDLMKSESKVKTYPMRGADVSLLNEGGV